MWDKDKWPSSRNVGLPGVDSASNRNKYQEYFLGVKAVRIQGFGGETRGKETTWETQT